MEVDPPDFPDKDDEIRYWKDLAQQMTRRKEDVERELEEFQENSQMLEKELEASLEQAEKTNRDLRQRNSRLNNESEQLRTRLDQQTSEFTTLQAKFQEMQTQHEQMLKYIRELEQKNDDLERAHRVIKVTEEEIEAKFNSALEKNALLESELDEKDTLKATVQRLKDEIRDLKQEMQVQARHQADNEKAADRVRNCVVDSNKFQAELEQLQNTGDQQQHLKPPVANSVPQTPPTLKIGNGVGGMIGNNNNNINLNPPLAPCTRLLAMNMIGDLMRKVGALESKLNSCRNSSREDPPARDLYRNKNQSRGFIPRPVSAGHYNFNNRAKSHCNLLYQRQQGSPPMTDYSRIDSCNTVRNNFSPQPQYRNSIKQISPPSSEYSYSSSNHSSRSNIRKIDNVNNNRNNCTIAVSNNSSKKQINSCDQSKLKFTKSRIPLNSYTCNY